VCDVTRVAWLLLRHTASNMLATFSRSRFWNQRKESENQ
jgi:hypothetical protein